jgi:hypothetical protein
MKFELAARVAELVLDTVIKIENLGKKYILRLPAGKERQIAEPEKY